MIKKIIAKSLRKFKLESRAWKLYYSIQQRKKTNPGKTDMQGRIEQNLEENVTDKIKNLCPEINEITLNVLTDMYSLNYLYGTEQKEPIQIEKTTRISIEQGSMINHIMRSENVSRSLEIGFAYGFSSIWILDSLLNKSSSFHIAIDPFEKSAWHGVGLKQIEKFGEKVNFLWESKYSIHSLSNLISKKEKFDFVFIDGNHRFDDVIVDFYLSDQLIEPNGIIALDDMWMPSIQKVAKFILTNRSYQVIPQSVSNMIVLKKNQNDNRNWNHFNCF